MPMTTPASSAKLVTIDEAKLQIAVWLEAHPECQEVITNDRICPTDRLLAQASDVLLSWGIDDEEDTHVDQLTVDQILLELRATALPADAHQQKFAEHVDSYNDLLR